VTPPPRQGQVRLRQERWECRSIYSAGCLLRRARSITTTWSTRRVCCTSSSANRLCMDNVGVHYSLQSRPI